MERVIDRPKRNFPASFLYNIFCNLQRKACLVLLVILLILTLGAPASAAVEGFVVKSSDGSYHQYCYEELLDSYASKILGNSNGLYEDFASKKPYALLDSVSGYVDYADILDQYARALIRGEKFNVHEYTESPAALRAKLPAVIKAVSLSAGKLVFTEITPVYSNPEEPKPDKVTEPEKPAIATPIISPPMVSMARAQQWAIEKGAHQRFIDIAPLYWDYGFKSGICPEVLYAQAAYETGFGRFSGIVPPEYNNWAGIKTVKATGDKPEDYEQFASPADGARAHFNHISAYVGLDPIGEPHGRYYSVSRLSWAGSIKVVEDLSGRWAPSPTYHERILTLLNEME